MKPYRGDAQHFAIEQRDFVWHTNQGRRFFAGQQELSDLGAVRAALSSGEEIWSR